LWPIADLSTAYKLQTGKSPSLFATAIHAILAEVANLDPALIAAPSSPRDMATVRTNITKI